MKRIKRTLSILLLMACLLVFCSCGGPEGTYKEAQTLLSQGKFSEAAEKFESIGSYEDSSTLALYCKAVTLAETGDYESGISSLEKLGEYKDCPMRITYYTGRYHESLVEQGDYEYLSSAETCYRANPLFLDSAQRADNLLLNLYQKGTQLMEEQEWSEASRIFSVLMEHNKALLQQSRSKQLEEQKGRRQRIAAGWRHTVGLKADGTVVAVGLNFNGQCDVEAWTDIVAVSAGDGYTVGLKADGTVVAVGDNDDGQCNVEAWTDIVAVSAG